MRLLSESIDLNRNGEFVQIKLKGDPVNQAKARPKIPHELQFAPTCN